MLAQTLKPEHHPKQSSTLLYNDAASVAFACLSVCDHFAQGTTKSGRGILVLIAMHWH